MVSTESPRRYFAHQTRSSYQVPAELSSCHGRTLFCNTHKIANGEEPTVSKFALSAGLQRNTSYRCIYRDNGYTKEEMKMYYETRKIMHL